LAGGLYVLYRTLEPINTPHEFHDDNENTSENQGHRMVYIRLEEEIGGDYQQVEGSVAKQLALAAGSLHYQT
jgi:hypothetical protein